MDRRRFLQTLVSTPVFAHGLAHSAGIGAYANCLVMIELKGGNDGLNCVVPYADAEYYRLRSRIGIPRDQVLQLDAAAGLHPALQPLMPLWQAGELAIIQGVGYPDPNLSHFRSIEIWDTASSSREYLDSGWLSRLFKSNPVPPAFAADGVIIGGNELGPVGGNGSRAIALASPEQFLRQARLADDRGEARSNRALAHILGIESNIQQAANRLSADYSFNTEFPRTQLGNSLKSAAQVIANKAGVAMIKVSLGGFDTHSGQPATHARLLGELAQSLASFKTALQEIDRWKSTLIVTYSEFGRRALENMSSGTDHGTSSVQFALGGRLRGGLYGAAPRLSELDGNGNLPFAVDFRELYATVIEKWWGLPSARALQGRFSALDVIKTA